MYPLLLMNYNHIKENARTISRIAQKHGVNITAVTKCFCGNQKLAEALVSGGIKSIGDSRISNLKNFVGLDCEKWLIRIPMLSECDDAVKYSDVSLNSELSTIYALNEAAIKQHKKHGIILMIDVGDLREGWFLGDGFMHDASTDDLARDNFNELKDTLTQILNMSNIVFMGIGANENCFGGTIPDESTFTGFIKLANYIKETYHIPCPVISGGNSGSYYLLDTGALPKEINNLRLGEVILFGHESSYDNYYKYLNHDNFILEVQIVEVKEKPSMPIGNIGQDAFGNKPVFEDKGIRRRAICALGKQDTSIEHLTPEDPKITIEGASSDHMIIDITDSSHHYGIGDIIRLRCDYVSLLMMCTSDYVTKVVTNC